MWTLQQRAVVIAVVLALLVYLSIRYAFQHHYLSNPPPPVGDRAAILADHLDPNTASRGELAEIPGFGESLAQAIVDYREQFQKTHPGELAFKQPSDLRKVHGIGVSREDSLQEYLAFPRLASTQPLR